MQLISVTGDQTDYISPGSHSRAKRATNRMKSNARIKCLSHNSLFSLFQTFCDHLSSFLLKAKILFWLSKKIERESQNVWMEK